MDMATYRSLLAQARRHSRRADEAEATALAYVRDPARSVELQFGLVRRALQAVVALRPGLGTHDADGHLLVIPGDAEKGSVRRMMRRTPSWRAQNPRSPEMMPPRPPSTEPSPLLPPFW